MIHKASFRGVPFDVTSSSLEIGRRTITHEYPYVTDPTIEDMGQSPRRFNIQAFISGEDYLNRYKELITAIEQEGPGELIHPELGRIQAQCTERVRFDRQATSGGIVRLRLSFIEVVSSGLQIESLASEQVDTASSIAYLRADALFAEELDEHDNPLQIIQSAISKVRELNGKVMQATGTINDIAGQIRELDDQLDQLLASPLLITEALRGAMTQLLASSSHIAEVFTALLNDSDTSADQHNDSGTSADQRVYGRYALITLARAVADNAMMVTSLDIDTYANPVLTDLQQGRLDGNDDWFLAVDSLHRITATAFPRLMSSKS